jgi:hypothetical protein
MSIQKKSLISTLKAAKKANFAGKAETEVKGEKVASMRMPSAKSALSAKTMGSAKSTFKSAKAQSFKSAKAQSFKSAKANY